jgi:hypothetical protein
MPLRKLEEFAEAALLTKTVLRGLFVPVVTVDTFRR